MSELEQNVVNMHDAKTQLSRLVERVERGEEIVIARRGKPVARLVAYSEKRYPIDLQAFTKGEIEILPGFDEADEEIERFFYEVDPDDPLFREPEEWEWPAKD